MKSCVAQVPDERGVSCGAVGTNGQRAWALVAVVHRGHGLDGVGQPALQPRHVHMTPDGRKRDVHPRVQHHPLAVQPVLAVQVFADIEGHAAVFNFFHLVPDPHGLHHRV